ncbi:hypothetical protein HY733_02010 [Candidatus Uhrbacteria bacterium]|nr:hypothetical protein [Candidatus Uhrbacteria bacterium]
MNERAPAAATEWLKQPETSPQDELRQRLAEHRDMYQLPGDPPLTQKDLNRYVKSRERFTTEVQWIEEILRTKSMGIQLRAVAMMEQVSKKEQAKLLPLVRPVVEKGLQGKYTWEAAQVINHTTPEDQERLRTMLLGHVETKLQDSSVRSRSEAIRFIEFVPQEDRARLIEQALSDKEWVVQEAAIKQINHASPQEQDRLRGMVTKLLRRDLRSESLTERFTAIHFMMEAPVQDRSRLIAQALRDPYEEVSMAAISYIKDVPQEEQKALRQMASRVVGRGLNHPFDWGVRWKAAQLIGEVAPEDQEELMTVLTKLVEKGLSQRTSEISYTAARIIALLPETERIPLIEEFLEQPDILLQRIAIQLIKNESAQEQERFLPRVVTLIEEGLKSKIPLIRKKMAELIVDLPREAQTGLVKRMFREHKEDHEMAVGLLEFLTEENRKEILEEDQTMHERLLSLASHTPLYEQHYDLFFRGQFEKTGSSTTLLDQVPGMDVSLRERLIVRHILPEAYLTWRKAYEASEFWKEQGFSYVPVEPIVSVTADKHDPENADVFTRVLNGPSCSTWGSQTTLYRRHISVQMEKIKEALRTLRIDHGHEHEGNFVLVFQRDLEGKIQLEKPPNVYLIDFDQSFSSLSSL